MKWASPDLLNLLWLLIPIAWGVFYLIRRRERNLEQVAAPAILPILIPHRLIKRIRTRNLLWLAALALCFLSLARPQWGFRWEEVKRRGLDVTVVLDTSRSMLTEDIKPNRLQQAKWGIRDLIAQLKGDRLGLVTFAGSSFLQCPLTIDYSAFAMTLDDVYAGIIPKGGTAIAQALKKGIESFDQGGDADRASVLMTDGEDNEGNPLSQVDVLMKRNIRVYAIGVGTLEGELIPENTDNQQAGFLKDRSGAVVKSSLHEDVLQKLALETGGAYVRSAPGDLGLERVFKESISKLKRDERESRMAKIYDERFQWPLALALALLLLEAALREGNGKTREVAA
ncbi:MAG: VWA domain-containing protein [Lentisphaerota bacterium]